MPASGKRVCLPLLGLIGLLSAWAAVAEPPGPATAPSTRPAKLPHIELDLEHKRVRVECQAVNAQAPLEYFLCPAGGAEHEAVLRTHAKPSNLHLALLLIGLNPGHPAQKIIAGMRPVIDPPSGPRLKLTCEFQKEGKTVALPAEQLMRKIRDKKPLGTIPWIFCGSRITPDGNYAADAAGHLVTVVNFPFSLIDVAEVRSNSNESLEWEINPTTIPEREATVWLVIEPAAQNGER